MSLQSLRGAVVWAVVPFVPEAPFFIYRRDDEPLELPDARPLLAAVRKGESEFRFLVRGKARPILILADRPEDRVLEFLALRLVRITELPAELRAAVVAHEDEFLFHVPPDRTPGLREEFAVMIAAPVRVHISAVDSVDILGRLDANELRVVHERFVRLHGLDLLDLIADRIHDLRRLQEEPPQPGSAS